MKVIMKKNWIFCISEISIVFCTSEINTWVLDLMQKLRHTESDRLSVQVHAYVDNMIEVAQLLEDSELKTEAIERAEDLEEELSRVGEESDWSVKVSVQQPIWLVS